MKKIIKILREHESGQTLILALLLLGVGTLVLAPMLSFMGSGLNAGVVVEDKTEELYAADAGVQDAIWKINNLPDSLPEPFKLEDVGDTYTYMLSDINGVEQVNVIIEYYYEENSGTYRVTSVANETEIIAFIGTIWIDYSGILDNVITSKGSYDIDHGVTVEPPEGEPGGPVEDYGGPWPTPEVLAIWYLRDVDIGNPYPFDEIDLGGVDASLGPEYIDGEFTIRNSSNTEATLTLTGTLYITGNTAIGGNKPWTLNLNGQTIFVESDVVGGGAAGTALLLNSNCKLTGSGCIIAVGDIDFSPSLLTDPDEYVLVLSIIGETLMHPSGDFYGTLAGSVHVDVKSGETPHIEWNMPPDDLNFPGGVNTGNNVWGIYSYDIHKSGL